RPPEAGRWPGGPDHPDRGRAGRRTGMSGTGLVSDSPEATDVVGASVDLLAAAVRDRTPVARLTDAYPGLMLDDAYRIQVATCARRIEGGERLIGAKLGLTSRAKQEQMAGDEPVYGRPLS